MSFISIVKRTIEHFFRSDVTHDRRAMPRRIYMRQGYLSFLNRPAHPPADCMIRDLSPAGAQIDIQEKELDESLFMGGVRLCIPDKGHERDCKIVWRRRTLMGLKFEGYPVPMARDYRHETQRGRG